MDLGKQKNRGQPLTVFENWTEKSDVTRGKCLTYSVNDVKSISAAIFPGYGRRHVGTRYRQQAVIGLSQSVSMFLWQPLPPHP